MVAWNASRSPTTLFCCPDHNPVVFGYDGVVGVAGVDAAVAVGIAVLLVRMSLLLLHVLLIIVVLDLLCSMCCAECVLMAVARGVSEDSLEQSRKACIVLLRCTL